MFLLKIKVRNESFNDSSIIKKNDNSKSFNFYFLNYFILVSCRNFISKSRSLRYCLLFNNLFFIIILKKKLKRTALHYAASHGFLDLIKYLI